MLKMSHKPYKPFTHTPTHDLCIYKNKTFGDRIYANTFQRPQSIFTSYIYIYSGQRIVPDTLTTQTPQAAANQIPAC